MIIAAGVVFYVLLALFPALAALVSLYGLFADPATIGQHLNDLSRVRAALDPVHGNREFSDA